MSIEEGKTYIFCDTLDRNPNKGTVIEKTKKTILIEWESGNSVRYKKDCFEYDYKILEEVPNQTQQGNPVWVKASEFDFQPNTVYFANWNGRPKGTGTFNPIDKQFVWREYGYRPVFEKEFNELLILDESPSTEYVERERQELTQAYIDEQDKSEKLQQEIQRLKELLKEQFDRIYKDDYNYSQSAHEEAWQQFKQTNNI